MEIGAAIGEKTLMGTGIPCALVGPEPVKLAEGLFLMSGFTPTEELEGPSPNMLRRGRRGWRWTRSGMRSWQCWRRSGGWR